MSSFYLRSPPRITQEQSTCWAAATASWSQVCEGVRSHTVDDLLEQGRDAGHVTRRGSLRGDDGFIWLRDKFSLHHERGSDMCDFPLMNARLRQSHVLYFFRTAQWRNSVHAVVVWGVEDNLVALMNPQTGRWEFPDPLNDFNMTWEMCMWDKYRNNQPGS